MESAITALRTLFFLLLMATTSRCSYERLFATTQPPFGRIVKGVKLSGGFMEVIQEEQCSEGVLRLTCRSLKAFIFVLEAEYRPNSTKSCGYEPWRLEEKRKTTRYKSRGSTALLAMEPKLFRGNYIEDMEIEKPNVDLRSSLNRRCSGHHHCRYTVSSDFPGRTLWHPATLQLKYACIPETAVRKYCNVEVKVTIGDGGYIKSPGYPLYYTGGDSCGWTFTTLPDQKIVLTFHDLNIRNPEADGSCVDVVRVRENGNTLFEYCGVAAGIKVISNTNLVTLDLIASANLYPARGFLLQYQALGCPDVAAPSGSYVSNSTLTSRTFHCKSGTVFPDTKTKKRILECKGGKWNESVDTLPNCIATSAVILKAENEHNRLSSLSGDNILGAGVRIGRGEDAVASGNGPAMDSTQSAMMKQADYVVDVVLPTVLIALLFVGNAIIVYIIFQYRKRKLPAVVQADEMALRNPAEIPQV